MLSANELANLGYVDSLESSLKASDDLTTVVHTFDIQKATLESEIKMEELQKLIKVMGDNANSLSGLLSFQTGIDTQHGQLHHSAVYKNPAALDSIFFKIFEQFIQLVNYTTLTETICSTSADEIENCHQSLTRMQTPPRHYVLPSLTSQDRIDKGLEGGTAYENYVTKEKLYGTESIIRNFGIWKIKPEVLTDNTRWKQLEDALHAYNKAVLEMEGVFFIENALSRKAGEFYFSEHYGSTDAVTQRAGYAAKNSDKLLAAMIPYEMYIFCSPNNKEFSEMVLTKYNPEKWCVMEYL